MENQLTLKDKLAIILKPNGKAGFLHSIVKNGKIFDIGCGNNSPKYVKHKRPDLHYTGLDIGVYNQVSDFQNYTDQLIMTSPENFDKEIAKFNNEFDAIISAHNLEHCDDYKKVVIAMIGALKPGGKLYMAFPCEKSVNFPGRKGTLNFYDDDTHKNIIKYDEIIDLVKTNGLSIDFTAKQYKPILLAFLGLLLEPISIIRKKVMPLGSTWALWGFETVIIGHKK